MAELARLMLHRTPYRGYRAASGSTDAREHLAMPITRSERA
jgi:hypothetical protein